MLKTILAPLSGTDCDLEVLALSLRLAKNQTGHVECLRIFPDVNAVATQIDQVGMAGWITLSDKLKKLEHEANERTKSAKANFDFFCRNAKIVHSSDPLGSDAVSMCFRQDTGDDVDRITQISRYYDGVVLAGGCNRDGRLPEIALGTIIMASGRPVVLAPPSAQSGPLVKIAVAWKNTAESARAVGAAMPLLERAERIEILCAEESPGESNCAFGCESMVKYFRWHGVTANMHIISSGLMSAADAVMDSARGVGADLLVMGAFGHSRMRELVFGGFTQRVLKGVDLPVLISH